jgi:hypothetical protein
MRLVAALAGALALALSACAKKTEEPADAAPAAEEPSAMEEAAPAEEPATEPMAEEAPAADMRQAAACVIDVPPETVCTADENACGKSSLCDCPAGYSYNPALGQCLLNLEGVGAATPVSLGDSDCAKAPAGVCTRDINVCGQPSTCACDEGFAWNDVAGKCLKDLSAPTE